LTSVADAGFNMDDIVVGAADVVNPHGSLMIGIVGKLQFKVNAARIDDFLRVGTVFGALSACVVILQIISILQTFTFPTVSSSA
jgi:hypothetical protein